MWKGEVLTQNQDYCFASPQGGGAGVRFKEVYFFKPNPKSGF